MIDPTRDEYRLAGVIERLAGRWRFLAASPDTPAGLLPVDVAATNETLVLGGHPPEGFEAMASGSSGVGSLAEARAFPPIEAHRLAIILLCGGLGTRGGGTIHPLLPVTHPRTGTTQTLLARQFDRLAQSPLRDATLLVHGSLLNETALRQFLDAYVTRPALYVAGLARA